MTLADRVLYSPERLAKIAEEAAKSNSVFSLDDRMGLVHDSMALSKAGLAKVSGALDLVNTLRNEKECESRRPIISCTRPPAETAIARPGVGYHLGQVERAHLQVVRERVGCGRSERLPTSKLPVCFILPVRERCVDFVRQTLFVPLVKKLGYEYPENEDPDTTMLRTAAISAAVSAKDPKCVPSRISSISHASC